MTKDEALDLALEALEKSVATCFDRYSHEQVMSRPEHFINQAITALKQVRSALVQSCYCPNCEAMGKELAALKAQPTVPDALFRHAPEHPQYIEGWNDCRAEMLRSKP
jgi:hypothetical protein